MANFLFDIGNVLLEFSFEPSLQKLFPENYPDPQKAINRLLARKDEFEAGQISAEDYIEWAIATLNLNISEDEFRNAWQNIFTVNQPMWDTVRNLRADGHQLILFSNTNPIHCPYVFGAFSELNLFHGAILSYEVGAIKPDVKIYEQAISQYNLIPHETFYIDDLPANIETGKALGFQTHQYDPRNHLHFESWLSITTACI